MNPEIIQAIQSRSAMLFEKVKAYREHLHAHPELSFQEKMTMAFISEQLTLLDIDHTTGVGGTGVVAVIRSSNQSI